MTRQYACIQPILFLLIRLRVIICTNKYFVIQTAHFVVGDRAWWFGDAHDGGGVCFVDRSLFENKFAIKLRYWY